MGIYLKDGDSLGKLRVILDDIVRSKEAIALPLDEPMSHQVVGGVKAHQAGDG